MTKYINKWTADMEDLLGSRPDKKLAVLWGIPPEIVTRRRHRLRIRNYPAKLNETLFLEGARICSICGKTKALSEFALQRNCYERLETQCKTCKQIKRRVRRRERKRYWVDQLGGCCARCGYNECLSGLDFHHVTNDGRQDKPSGWISDIARAKSEVVRKELDQCALLCRCCHAGFHSEELQLCFVKREDLGWAVASQEANCDEFIT